MTHDNFEVWIRDRCRGCMEQEEIDEYCQGYLDSDSGEYTFHDQAVQAQWEAWQAAIECHTNTAIDHLCEDSIVRRNLLTRPGYAPYCGETCNVQGRTTWDKDRGQFVCKCGWQSEFPDDFVAAYRLFRINSQKCSKCGVTVGEKKSKYCGDGTDKDNPHRWVMPVY